MAEGFLGRWSQRKQAQREGRVLAEPPTPKQLVPTQRAPSANQGASRAGLSATGAPGTQPEVDQPAAEAEKEALPTLDDVKALQADSSFAPFVARDVAPEVRNAAMKKLFTDPHYNLMDRLDIYIDDYSQPDPIPAAMLRQMASAQFLNLFDEEAPPKLAHATAQQVLLEDADIQPGVSVAQSEPVSALPVAGASTCPELVSNSVLTAPSTYQTTHHDHTDLRLQPNHAAGPKESGRVAG